MKIYLLETNAYSENLFVEDNFVKLNPCDIIGLDRSEYAPMLAHYLDSHSDDLNGFYEMPGAVEDFTFSDFMEELGAVVSEDAKEIYIPGNDTKITFLYSDEI